MLNPICSATKHFSFSTHTYSIFPHTYSIFPFSYIATGWLSVRQMPQVPLQFNACLLLANYNYDEWALNDVSAAHTKNAENIWWGLLDMYKWTAAEVVWISACDLHWQLMWWFVTWFQDQILWTVLLMYLWERRSRMCLTFKFNTLDNHLEF